MPRRSIRVTLLVFCVLLAGCSAPMADEETVNADGASEGPPDPPADRTGWEAGYWHNESISVDQSDGLSDAEMDAYVGRAMARVEYLRGEEFTDEVPVSVISRDEYRRQSQGGGNESGAFDAWNNQVWEALFVVGEETDSQRALGATHGSSVLGFYSPAADEIKIITETPERPAIQNATLVHELVHALQDQRHNLSAPTYRSRTQDGGLAIDGLVEGEARYVERTYVERCTDEWECVAPPQQSGGSEGDGEPPRNVGILVTVYQPYSDGPVYVHDLYREGGWDAVDAAFDSPPASTEQVIHLTDEEPQPIAYEDRARGGWSLFPKQGENGSDTVGEASIYAMFWYQAQASGADTVDPRELHQTTRRYDTFNYSAEPSAGWANDRVFPYRRGSGSDAEYGYVWVTEWDSRADARQFHRAYASILVAHGAERRADGRYVIPSGGFADAFRVTRRGTRVTIVNGPTPATVDDIRPRSATGS